MSGPHDLFELPGEQWRALVPRFEYLLDDLTAEREEVLRARSGPPLARLACAAVHAAARRVLHSVLDEQRAEALMGTWAEDMMERGVQKGLAMGRQEGRQEGRAEGLSGAVVRIPTARRRPASASSPARTWPPWSAGSIAP